MTIERFFASPLVARITLNVVVFLAVVLMATIVFSSFNAPTRHSVLINDCALVLTRSGQECR